MLILQGSFSNFSSQTENHVSASVVNSSSAASQSSIPAPIDPHPTTNNSSSASVGQDNDDALLPNDNIELATAHISDLSTPGISNQPKIPTDSHAAASDHNVTHACCCFRGFRSRHC